MKTTWHPVEDPRAQRVLGQEADGLSEIQVQGRKLVLVRWQGQLHCLDARCPHQGGPLGGGYLEKNGELVCPWHRFRFDVCTGSGSSGGYFVNTYPLKLENRCLFVELPKRGFWGFWR
jgi:3-phenylpropionate/trans-cinnamate dioxygenase ferredoxin subunit